MHSKILIFVLVLLSSCNENPPIQNIIDIPEGRRDYTWTIDTLYYPYNPIFRMWGNSPTDVWAISGGGDLDKTIFHFDGTVWKRDAAVRPLNPHSVYGFSSNNVYIGGMNGMIWHYDGVEWKELIRLEIDNNDRIVFDNMWGDSPDNLYAFGAYPDSEYYYNMSVIAHYNKKKWSMLNTDGLIGVVERLFIDNNDNKIYLQTYRMGGGKFYDSSLVFEYYQGKYKRIYSNIWARGRESDLSLIDNEIYFILGNKIAKRKNNQFQTFLNIDNPNFYQRIWGRSSKDIFLFMTDGLAHFNGNDIKYLQDFDKPRTHILGSAIFENEVFFLVHESSTNLNLIYHGKLTL